MVFFLRYKRENDFFVIILVALLKNSEFCVVTTALVLLAIISNCVSAVVVRLSGSGNCSISRDLWKFQRNPIESVPCWVSSIQ